MTAREVNFDGLVGPTHSYAGLSFGNVASAASAAEPSNPRAAALQGLEKMRLLHDLGVEQALLPPHERPHMGALARAGFGGEEAVALARAAREAPDLLAACSSASAMWTANAATVAPSCDTVDGRVHVVPANLNAKVHRAIEPPTSARVLRAVLPDPALFAHHAPLVSADGMSDEGAANHLRLAPRHGAGGLHVLVYGRAVDASDADSARVYPARQTRAASAAVARLLDLPAARGLLVRQRRSAIDAGAFHNDVVSVANEGFLFHHEEAFALGPGAIAAIRERYREATGERLVVRCVGRSEVGLDEAVASYLFNSQLVSLASGEMALIAPVECDERPRVRACIDRIIGEPDNPVGTVRYVDLRQSMRNGGGPACLRLRLVLTGEELDAVAPGVRFDAGLHERLAAWVRAHYRDRLAPADLADPQLLDESRRALDALTAILGLGALYDFQAGPDRGPSRRSTTPS